METIYDKYPYTDVPDDVKRKHIEKCNQCERKRTIYKMTGGMWFDWLDCPYNCENDFEHYIAEVEQNDNIES